MRGRCHDTASGQLLDRLEVEVLEDGAGLALYECAAVLDDQELAVAEDPVGDRRRRFAEENEVDRPPAGALERGDQVSQLTRAEALVRRELDRDVEIAPGMRRAARARPEHQGVEDALVLGEKTTHGLHAAGL